MHIYLDHVLERRVSLALIGGSLGDLRLLDSGGSGLWLLNTSSLSLRCSLLLGGPRLGLVRGRLRLISRRRARLVRGLGLVRRGLRLLRRGGLGSSSHRGYVYEGLLRGE